MYCFGDNDNLEAGKVKEDEAKEKLNRTDQIDEELKKGINNSIHVIWLWSDECQLCICLNDHQSKVIYLVRDLRLKYLPYRDILHVKSYFIHWFKNKNIFWHD